MANEEHLKILQQGVEAWNQWRKESYDIVPDLGGANLVGSDLDTVDFRKTKLQNADLTRANLRGVNFGVVRLGRVHHRGVNPEGADLRGANLEEANLFWTNLYGANLRQANLNGTLLTSVILSAADLTETQIGSVSFADVDLSWVVGLAQVIQSHPSSIGVDTLALTLRGSGGRFTKEQLVFFENAGVPATLLEYLPSILETNPLQFYACFISYSTRDEDFAEPLNQDLNQSGIKTWKWDRDAVRGRDLAQNIDLAIRSHDKTILVCSADSLTSPQVEREIQQALDKEVQIKTANAERRKEALARRERPPTVDADVLIPIRLDDTIFKWDSHLKGEVTRRMVADFTDAPPGSDKYQRELQQLIKALNPQSWPPAAAIT